MEARLTTCARRHLHLRADPLNEGRVVDSEVGLRHFPDRASQAIVGQWLSSFKEFPIRQKPASFDLDEVMQKLSSTGK